MKRTIHPVSVFQKTKQWEKMPKYILEDTSIAGIIDTIRPTMKYSHCFKEAILWDIIHTYYYDKKYLTKKDRFKLKRIVEEFMSKDGYEIYTEIYYRKVWNRSPVDFSIEIYYR